jgi:hypothetical protein
LTPTAFLILSTRISSDGTISPASKMKHRSIIGWTRRREWLHFLNIPLGPLKNDVPPGGRGDEGVQGVREMYSSSPSLLRREQVLGIDDEALEDEGGNGAVPLDRVAHLGLAEAAVLAPVEAIDPAALGLDKPIFLNSHALE